MFNILLVTHGIDGFDTHGSRCRRQSCQHPHRTHHEGCKDSRPETYLEMGCHDAVFGITHLQHRL